MADARNSASEELPAAAAAAVAAAAKDISEQQAMNEALEAQVQDGVEELKRVSLLRQQVLLAITPSMCPFFPPKNGSSSSNKNSIVPSRVTLACRSRASCTASTHCGRHAAAVLCNNPSCA